MAKLSPYQLNPLAIEVSGVQMITKIIFSL